VSDICQVATASERVVAAGRSIEMKTSKIGWTLLVVIWVISILHLRHMLRLDEPSVLLGGGGQGTTDLDFLVWQVGGERYYAAGFIIILLGISVIIYRSLIRKNHGT